MKYLFFIFLSLMTVFSGIHAQTCSNNPLVDNGSLTPDPLKPGDTGQVSFTFTDDLGSYADFANDPISIVVCFLHIEPTNGIMALSGVGSGWFTWAYDQTSNCLLGNQNQTIYPNNIGGIFINFNQVTPQVCDAGNNTMGFNVNLQPAACMNGVNNSADDITSHYTCVNPTSVEQIYEQLKLEVELFPNPASTILNLALTNGLDAKTLNFFVIDMKGSVILDLGHQKIQNGEQHLRFNINDLSEGNYFLGIRSEAGEGGVVQFSVLR